MAIQRIERAMIYWEDHQFRPGTIEIEDGKILAVLEEKVVTDPRYVIPGLVDIHFHGCMGDDLCDADLAGIGRMARYEGSQGVTTICPASMTMSEAELHDIMTTIGAYEEKDGAHFAGINMEGPFISKKKKGAQAEENIIPCNAELFRALQKETGGRVRLVDIAPEIEGAMEFIDELKDEVNISIAHTEANYEIATEAFARGARHVTHLCNAMPPFHHRDPGVIGAAADAGAYVEMICDGVHIHPAMVRSLFRLFGSERICMISDSMRAAGLEDGEYTLGGQAVFVKGPVATLEDGTLAGSVTNLMKCLQRAVREMKIPLEDAVRCASENPAKEIGIFDTCGSIAAGKNADLVVLDQNLEVQDVWISGERQ